MDKALCINICSETTTLAPIFGWLFYLSSQLKRWRKELFLVLLLKLKIVKNWCCRELDSNCGLSRPLDHCDPLESVPFSLVMCTWFRCWGGKSKCRRPDWLKKILEAIFSFFFISFHARWYFLKVGTPVGCILIIFVSNHTFPHLSSSLDGLPPSWDDEPAIFIIRLWESEHMSRGFL